MVVAIATIIIPTHSHPFTLDLSVNSVLSQTIRDIEIVIIGDGVMDDTRSLVRRLILADPRVRFLDMPKSKSRAEEARDAVIRSSGSKYIGYHGDDDLMLSTHLEEMIFLLNSTQSDFVNPLPVFAGRDGKLIYLPTDLSMQECLDWHMKVGHNAVSLTGVVHTRDSYMKLSGGWRVPPAGYWSDHFMWQEFFSSPGFKACTAKKATTIKPSQAARQDFSPARRRGELLNWVNLMQQGGFRETLDELAFEAIRTSSINHFLRASRLEDGGADNVQPGKYENRLQWIRHALLWWVSLIRRF